ncbi:hypothetical protein D3C71_2004900 [compost metagenome]
MTALEPEQVAVSCYLFLHLFGLYTQQCLKTQVASPVVVIFHLRHAEHIDDLWQKGLDHRLNNNLPLIEDDLQQYAA